ncbi:MAG: hypothetical protein LC808_35175, partial [Actinobacteria bacterium]|nr:hypothetical protein [Actinomycetota bacterium]
MGDAQPAEVTPIVDRLEAVLDHGGEIPTAVITEARSAIELVWGGRSCAAVSVLLATRWEPGCRMPGRSGKPAHCGGDGHAGG